MSFSSVLVPYLTKKNNTDPLSLTKPNRCKLLAAPILLFKTNNFNRELHALSLTKPKKYEL
jgi:hypothetical protein